MYRKDLECGISVAVLREGLFVFNFSKWPDRDKRCGTYKLGSAAQVRFGEATVLNTHLACLYTAVHSLQHQGISKMVLSPGDLFSGPYSPPYLGGIPSSDPRWPWLALSRFPSTYSENMPLNLDGRINFRMAILKRTTIERSFEIFEKLLQSQGDHTLTVVDLYLRSCRACEEHNYSLCAVLAWAAAENLLNVLWERYIDECDKETAVSDVKFISNKRREKLNGGDFTASVVTEMLSLVNRINFALYENLDKVRKARNYWLHDLKAATSGVADLSLQVVGELIELVDGIPIKLFSSPGMVLGNADWEE